MLGRDERLWYPGALNDGVFFFFSNSWAKTKTHPKAHPEIKLWWTPALP